MNPAERVLGWDLLRGLAAIAVASYHLLLWQEVTAIHAWGSYGVYLFFVLSGASLAYSYAPSFADGSFRYGAFLWVRYVRLAPLYLALLVLVLPWKLRVHGASLELGWTMLLNASFLFGVFDPASTAMLVGGWSLGIEVVFYLLFPLLMWAALRPRLGVAVFLALLALQAAWVLSTAGGDDGYTANAIRYHQVPAFGAYFMGGCLIGQWRRRAVPEPCPALPGSVALIAGFALLLAINPLQQGDELLGWRGVLSAGLCFALVWLAGRLQLRRRSDRLATVLGEATYGLYLLHPVLYFGIAFVVLPKLGWAPPENWPLAVRGLFTAALLAVGFGLAVAVERRLERPLRAWSKRPAWWRASRASRNHQTAR